MTEPATVDAEAFPLTPMQRGMLSQTLASPGGGVYTVIASYRVQGPLHASTFIDAWRRVVNHHPMLRTAFEWADRAEAVQRVEPEVTLEAREEDWRAVDVREHAARLRRLMDAEQAREFDLTAAPLFRIVLVRCADDVHELVVAHHHILFDGSCKALLFSQAFATYDALLHGTPVHLEPARPYREFVEWLRAQPLDEAEVFWKAALHGFTTPSKLWEGGPTTAPEREYAEHRFQLDGEDSDRLRRLARQHRLTLNSLISGMWALLLARVGRVGDVLFGASLNTRPTDLDGVDTMVGLFINTVPVRVHVDRQRVAAEWLKALQWSQADAREHGHVPLPTILRWSEVAGGQSLFDSIVVFENNAGYDGRVERYGNLEIVGVDPLVRTSLPLTVRCVPGSQLECHLLYDARRFSAKTITAIAASLRDALTTLPSMADAPLSDLIAALDALDRERDRFEADTYRQRLQGRLKALRTGARDSHQESR